jgi:hypothetical protein
MGALLEVKVLPQADHSERSEAQLREGDRPWRGSVERTFEPMNKNRIEGEAGGCVMKECGPYMGTPCLTSERTAAMP